MRNLRSLFLCLAATACGPTGALAQDKSASSAIQLPAAGGTVTREEGAFSLSGNTGSANFTLPLPELPTRGKHAPAVKLSYSQFAGDSGGGMGIGWGINVPSINVNDDLGTAIGGFKPNGDFFSRLSLMGSRLVFLGKTSDGSGLRFRPEFAEEFISITFLPAPFVVPTLGPQGEAQSVTIPSGFEVQRPDGTRQYFSGGEDVAEGSFGGAEPYVTRWPLVLEVSAERDPISYSYVKHNNRAYLSEIAFAGGRSTYRFDLADTEANLVSNVTGVRQVNGKLFSRIIASFDGDIYNQWCLSYVGREGGSGGNRFTVRAHPDCLAQAQADLTPKIDPNSINVLDQLRMIYRFGDSAPLSAETEQLTPIALDYSSWTATELAARDIVYEAPKLAFAGDLPPANFELADLNMDALVDVVQSGDAETRVLLGEGSLDSSFERSASLKLKRTGSSGLLTEVVPRLSDNRFQFADINGDSFADIVEVGDEVIFIYAGDAAGGFAYIGREIRMPGVSPSLFEQGRSRFLDINMDNLSDIVSTQLDADGRTQWRIFLNLTRREADGEHRVNFGALSRPFPFFAQDAAALAQPNTRLSDINGDRLPDLLVIQPARQGFCTYENRGTIFSREAGAPLFGDFNLQDPVCGAGRFTAISGMQPTDRLETMWYVDANGDGIMDFASMGQTTDAMRVWLGYGDGSFLRTPIALSLNLRVQVGPSVAGFRSRVADLDADGQSEILVFQQPAGEDVKSVVVIDFNRAGPVQLVKANLLTTVEFGSGLRHDVRYATSTDELLRDKANGRQFTTLHFPVVLAKQMVTSEGVPGLPRALVQAEEFFYHRPFFDTVNKRFIGFSEVEKLTYGDEFAADSAPTRRTGYTNEQYYTFASSAADLHLAGKLKVSRTYTVRPDAVLVASAEGTATLDPNAPFQHSLSTATRGQKLPEPGTLLNCRSAVWEAVPLGDGTNYLRKTSEGLTVAASPEQQQPTTDESCVRPTKRQVFSAFDEFNLAGRIETRAEEVAGPLGLSVPSFSTSVRNDFAASRAALAPLGIVNAVSERTVSAGARLMSVERLGYAPASGRLISRELDVFSSLQDVPDGLDAFRTPVRTLKKGFDFDVFGNTIAVKDDLGTTETVTFDPSGVLPLEHRKLNGTDAALDQVTRMAYDGPRAGQLSLQVSPLGARVSYAYDSLTRKVLERADDGAERRYSYKIGRNGLPSLILTSLRRYASATETPAGESEFIDQAAAFNADGTEIAKMENAAGGGVRVFAFKQYNRQRNLIFEWTPFTIEAFAGVEALDLRKVFALGDVPRPTKRAGTAFGYDEAGRRVTQTTAAGKVTVTSYHQWGTNSIARFNDGVSGEMQQQIRELRGEQGVAAVAVGDGRGSDHVTTFHRDVFGFLSEIVLPGETTPRRLSFSSAGDLESQTIPGMGSRFFFFDNRGRQRVEARVSESGQVETVETDYDFLDRRLVERVNGRQTVSYIYDRAVQMASAEGFADPHALPLGQPTEISHADPNGLLDVVQRYGYDGNGRLVRHEVTIGDQTFTEAYSLTLDGRITRSVDPGGLAATFGLGPDANLRSVAVEHPAIGGRQSVVDNVLYSPEGRIRRIDYRGGAFTDMVYDPETQFLESIRTEARAEGQAVVLQDLEMVFNGNGSINVITDRATSAGHVDRSGTFEYDFKNQLTRHVRFGEDARFDYSAAGAFIRNDEFSPGVALTAAAGAATGLIPAGTDVAPYTFDGFGQLASSPTVTEAVFDPHGRLIRATTARSEVAFGYDQTGRRLYQRIADRQNPASVALYLYPTQGYTVGPKGAESFAFVGDQRLMRLEHATGRWFYYLKDHLSSSDFVMNSDGLPVEQMLYRAFGTELEPAALSPDWARHVAANAPLLPAEKTRHRFTGHELDDATGLYYQGQRYYDPRLGRFVSPDPLYLASPDRCERNPIACNLFAYANNNPMAFIDPTGLEGVVAGDAAFRRQTEDALRKLDPSARVDSTTGEITKNWLQNAVYSVVGIFSSSAGHNAGRELVSRIIDSPQKTTIEFRKDTASTGWDQTQDPSKAPVDAVIHWDPTYSADLAEFDAGTGTVSPVRAPQEIVIGHELIHATHLNEGSVNLNPVTYKGIDGRTLTENFQEEVRTVGVGGVAGKNDITENHLRDMNGYSPRNHYYDPAAGY
ncbi:MAG TPA: RHS repeat-associated core domain-containing protein [Mesorhizobium sp.]|jgi:RHS repeat-associated protein|nr:RHS repeat-associated core domain-containing protein [Mesorhizobium sp.]